MESENKKDSNCTMVMIWVVMVIMALAVFCCIAGFFFNIFEYENEDNIVITFLGALASFVVISNYAQLVDIRDKTEKDLLKMGGELKKSTEHTKEVLEKNNEKIDAMDERLKKLESLRLNSNLIVDLNKIRLEIENEDTTEDRAVLLLKELKVYESINDEEVVGKVMDVLNSSMLKAVQSSKVASEVLDVVMTFTPQFDEFLDSLFEVAFEIIDFALAKDNPKSAEYGFTIMKWVKRRDGKFTEEGKKDLNRLKEKFKDNKKIRFIETLIKDLDNSDLSWPVFDKEVQDWIDKNSKN